MPGRGGGAPASFVAVGSVLVGSWFSIGLTNASPAGSGPSISARVWSRQQQSCDRRMVLGCEPGWDAANNTAAGANCIQKCSLSTQQLQYCQHAFVNAMSSFTTALHCISLDYSPFLPLSPDAFPSGGLAASNFCPCSLSATQPGVCSNVTAPIRQHPRRNILRA